MIHAPDTATRRRSRPHRGFRTADAVVLIGAVAVGLALSSWVEAGTVTLAFGSRTKPASFFEWFRKQVLENPGSWRDAASELSELTLHMVILSVPFLAMLSLAMIPIQLIPPRPRRRRLAVQPGTAATCATVVALTYAGTFYAIVRLATSKIAIAMIFDALFVVKLLPVLAGLAIVSAWTTLVVAGRWRAEPTWIDRLGRIVAVAWITAGLFTTCHYLVFRFFSFSASMMIF